MAEKMTKAMLAALQKIEPHRLISAYSAHVRMDTLEALERRGFVEAQRGLGSIAFPHTSTGWRITEVERRALDEASHGR